MDPPVIGWWCSGSVGCCFRVKLPSIIIIIVVSVLQLKKGSHKQSQGIIAVN